MINKEYKLKYKWIQVTAIWIRLIRNWLKELNNWLMI